MSIQGSSVSSNTAPTVRIMSSIKAIQQAIQLNIKSVGNLHVKMQPKGEENAPNQFYTSTNHVFSKMSLTGHSSLKFVIKQYELDVSQLQWQNLNSLDLLFLDEESIMELLLKMPSLQTLRIHTIDSADLMWDHPSIYRAEDMEATMDCVHNSRLTSIALIEFSEDWTTGDAADFTMALMLAHRKLERVVIQELKVELEKSVEKSKLEYLHLKDIFICQVNAPKIKILW